MEIKLTKEYSANHKIVLLELESYKVKWKIVNYNKKEIIHEQ